MNGLLIIIAFVLVIAAGFLLARISGMLFRRTSGLSGEKLGQFNAWLLPVFLITALGLLSWYIFTYRYSWLPLLASEHGTHVDRMFWITMGITGFVFLLTQFLLFFFAFRFRAAPQKSAYFQKNNNRIELLWTLIPLLTFIFLFVFSQWSWKRIHRQNPQSLNIEIMAEQFNWRVRYSGADNRLGTYDYRLINEDNAFGLDLTDSNCFDDFSAVQLHLPKDVPVKLHIRSRDVIHSVYMPNFRLKMDAVPGMPTSFEFTPRVTTQEVRDKTGDPEFNYELACAELCGRMHFAMLLIVVVEEKEEFQQWARAQKKWIYKQPLLRADRPVKSKKT